MELNGTGVNNVMWIVAKIQVILSKSDMYSMKKSENGDPIILEC